MFAVYSYVTASAALYVSYLYKCQHAPLRCQMLFNVSTHADRATMAVGSQSDLFAQKKINHFYLCYTSHAIEEANPSTHVFNMLLKEILKRRFQAPRKLVEQHLIMTFSWCLRLYLFIKRRSQTEPEATASCCTNKQNKWSRSVSKKLRNIAGACEKNLK